MPLAIVPVLVGATLIAVLQLGRKALTTSPAIEFCAGSSLRLLGVTWGTNHIQGCMAAKLVARLPRRLAQPLLQDLPNGGQLNTRTTSETALVVWMEYSGPAGGTTTPSGAMLRPVGGTLAGRDEYLGLFIPPGAATATVGVEFHAWPRRSEELECAILEQGSHYESTEAGSFRFKNDAIIAGGLWNPASLPATYTAGDLQVTLLAFVTGRGDETRSYGPDGKYHQVFQMSRDPHPKAFVSLALDSPRGNNLISGCGRWSDDYHEFNLNRIPPGATHLDLTFSVQPTRYVEFMVAPNQVTNDYKLRPD
ncbi:MAG: hypothetical protein MUC91_10305 [Verrucomicrobia bacterium]|nr:hypothetical protein [Verrucomicrobiota bacterium]